MAAHPLTIKHGWVWALSIFIFFFNTFLLPEGFTYTLLLTPVWIYLLYLQGRLNLALILPVPFLLYAAVHLILGVDVDHYLISVTLMVALCTFLVAAGYYINNKAVDLDFIFRDIAILNFLFTIAAIPLLFFPSLSHVTWYTVPISKAMIFPRLKLFTEEASHYSFLIAPIVIYFYSRVLFFKTTNPILTLFIVSFPLALSFSLGVLSCILISGAVITVVYFGRVFSTFKRRSYVILITGLLAALFWAANRFYPGNPLFARIHNIFNGEDTSARGRTYEAFILANKVIAQKSFLWGIGPGQLKIIGRNIIIHYYSYFNIPKVTRIPNACAETIVCFGYIGFSIRIIAELVLFFVTKVYTNPYRLWLFLFVFIYQFTGSYITNVAEYIVWMIAFSPVFPEYTKRPTDHSLKTAML